MFQEFLDLLKKPTTKLIELSSSEEIKKILIKALILAIILPILGLLTTVIHINKEYGYNEKKYSASYYSDSDRQEKKQEAAEDISSAIKNAKLVKSFFTKFAIILVTMATIALVLFLIAKFVKSPKKYCETLSMVVNTGIVLTAGFILAFLLSLIYAPLSVLAYYITYIFTFYSLMLSFRDSLTIENSNGIVFYNTIIMTAILIIAVILFCSISGISLKNLSNISDLFSSSSSLSSMLN